MQVRANAESIAFYKSDNLEKRKTNSRLLVRICHFDLLETVHINYSMYSGSTLICKTV